MKVVSSILFIFLFVTNSFAQYDIKGRIKGLSKSEVYLAHYFGYNQQVIKDTVIANEEGEFNFQGSASLPKGLYLISFLKSKYIDVVMEEANFSFSLDTTDILKSIVFQNSDENTAFYTFQRKMNELYTQINQPSLSLDARIPLQREVQQFQQQWKKANASLFVSKLIESSFDPEIPTYSGVLKSKSDTTKMQMYQYQYFKKHFFDGMDLTDERMVRTPFLQRKLERFFKDLVVQDTDSIARESDLILAKATDTDVRRYIIYKIASTYENNPILGTDGAFVHLAEKYYIGEPALWDTSTVRRMKERIDIIKPLLLGKPFPKMHLTDVAGKEINFNSLTHKYTVVFVYDPDCSHCKQEAPKLVALTDYFKAKNVGVVACSIVRDKDAWKKFITEFNFSSWVNGIDIHLNPKTGKEEYYTDFRNTFDVYSTPVVYVLDQQKKIVGKRIPVENLKDFIQYLETRRK
ncbi:redoxin domain-containing protein [Aquirufa sp. HETE-83D]|uniref:Redoxin domain-containing protein n=1 Tax=Aquirufa esocilacus TaxID=3096513 RepID=A0ABW6DGM4_9BACT